MASITQLYFPTAKMTTINTKEKETPVPLDRFPVPPIASHNQPLHDRPETYDQITPPLQMCQQAV